MEGYSAPISGTKGKYPAVGRGWEMNTGMFAVKKSSAPLLQKWIDVFKQNSHIFSTVESGEQQGCEMLIDT
jgi:hypothetical protein